MTVLRIVHPYSETPEIKMEPSAYCPKTHFYMVPDNENFLQMAKTMYQFEKERNEWIRKYDRVLKGLKYWRNQALDSKIESKK